MLKAATIWAAVILTAATSLGLGYALGTRPDLSGPTIAKLLSEWQSLIGALTAIFAVGATLQAGWWALSGSREQIQAAKNEQTSHAENRYRSIRAVTLVNLNRITQFSTDSLKYIYEELTSKDPPDLDKHLIENLALLIEANRQESASQAASLIEKIQLVQSWIFDIHVEKEKVNNVVPIAALQCLILYAESMKWFEFARGKTETIEVKISYDDIERAIHILRATNHIDLSEDKFEYEELKREIKIHFKIFDSESEPSESNDLNGDL